MSPLSEAGFTGCQADQSAIVERAMSSHYYKLFVRLGVFLIGRFPSYKSFFISLATEFLDFVNGVLDGNIAGWGVWDVDRATGGKLGDEPPIVWFSRLAMDDDRCPVDADVGNEVRR